MKLTPPFPLSTIVQKFGDNAIDYQGQFGTIGHPGMDFGVPWGEPIPCAIDSYCYSVILNKDPAFYQEVCTIVEDETGVYEIIYGHISSALVKGGDTLKSGEIVAQVGNTGTVYANGTEVSEASKLAGGHAGAHLHFQVRILSKELTTSPTMAYSHYLNDGYGQLVINGYRYGVPHWDNGMNGTIDPSQFLEDNLSQTIKQEIPILQENEGNPSVYKALLAVITNQIKSLFHL